MKIEIPLNIGDIIAVRQEIELSELSQAQLEAIGKKYKIGFIDFIDPFFVDIKCKIVDIFPNDFHFNNSINEPIYIQLNTQPLEDISIYGLDIFSFSDIYLDQVRKID